MDHSGLSSITQQDFLNQVFKYTKKMERNPLGVSLHNLFSHPNITDEIFLFSILPTQIGQEIYLVSVPKYKPCAYFSGR